MINSRAGVILIMASRITPFKVWTIPAFIQKIPVEIEEAARNDGQMGLAVFNRGLPAVEAAMKEAGAQTGLALPRRVKRLSRDDCVVR